EPGEQVGDGLALEQRGLVSAPEFELPGSLAVHHREVRLGGLLGLVVHHCAEAAVAGPQGRAVGLQAAEQYLHERRDIRAPLDVYGLDDALEGDVAMPDGVMKS